MTSPSSDGSRALGKAADSRFGPKLRGFSECLSVQRQVVQHLSPAIPTVQALRFGLLGADPMDELAAELLIGNLGEPSVYDARPLGAREAQPASGLPPDSPFSHGDKPVRQHPYRGRPSSELHGTTNSFRAS
jgi:hypothetical protein